LDGGLPVELFRVRAELYGATDRLLPALLRLMLLLQKRGFEGESVESK